MKEGGEREESRVARSGRQSTSTMTKRRGSILDYAQQREREKGDVDMGMKQGSVLMLSRF